MLLQLNRDRFFFISIVILCLLRVFYSRVQACLPDFDCNSYIQMIQNLSYDPLIPGHHAMRLLPSLLASKLVILGLDNEKAFRLLSGLGYVSLGILTFWVLKKSLKPLIAFSFTLLCLAPHEAMRIPLHNVYQTCDMFTYPLTLGLIYFSIQRNIVAIFGLSLIGMMIRQNLFILGALSLIYGFYQTKRIDAILYSVILGGLYFFMQSYFHASSVFSALLHPPAEFFTFSHLWWIIQDSRLLELFIPVIPFLILDFKEIISFFIRYWHLGIYVSIVIGQPFLGYHLTGNNFQRLALQGVWVIFIVLGLQNRYQQWTNNTSLLFFIYALCMYFTWGAVARSFLMMFLMIALVFLNWQERNKALIKNHVV